MILEVSNVDGQRVRRGTDGNTKMVARFKYLMDRGVYICMTSNKYRRMRGKRDAIPKDARSR